MSGGEQLGFLFQAAVPRRIWTVRDLVSAVRTAVESAYTDVYVEGEISNHRPAESGHLYFTLKDGDAQLRIVMFRSQARLLRFKPENGMQVIARGRVTIYEARGSLQLSAEYLEPKGAGALQVAFEQLKAKLAVEGLFDQARKRPLPAAPKRIGIVTSPRGAVIQDMLNILRRRHHGVDVILYPAQVQGEFAATEVGAGVKYLSSGRAGVIDVLIIARGGGSVEDLAAFNDEALARIIAASPVPTISAIGHETDFTIADFVADLRAPTPSAAAEIVSESKQRLEERVAELHNRLRRGTEYRLLMARKHTIELTQHAAFGSIRQLLNRRQQRVDDLRARLLDSHRGALRGYRSRLDIATTHLRARDLRVVLRNVRRGMETLQLRLAGNSRRALAERRRSLDALSGRLNALSPLRILDRGYALVIDSAGNIVKDADQVVVGESISTRLAKGALEAQVTAKRRASQS
jgi:exodeoxyribonuclease VII large subunit